MENDSSVQRRKAPAVAIAAEPNIEVFSYDERITVSHPVPEPRAVDGQMLENRTLFDKIPAQPILAISSDGRILASGDANGVVSIWNIPNATREIQLNKTSSILSMAISPDGKFLAIGLAEALGEPADTMRVYDLRTHSTQRAFRRKSAAAVAWSQDSRRVAVGLEDGSALLAEVDSGTEPQRIVLSASPVVALDFHPSGFFWPRRMPTNVSCYTNCRQRNLFIRWSRRCRRFPFSQESLNEWLSTGAEIGWRRIMRREKCEYGIRACWGSLWSSRRGGFPWSILKNPARTELRGGENVFLHRGQREHGGTLQQDKCVSAAGRPASESGPYNCKFKSKFKDKFKSRFNGANLKRSLRS